MLIFGLLQVSCEQKQKEQQQHFHITKNDTLPFQDNFQLPIKERSATNILENDSNEFIWNLENQISKDKNSIYFNGVLSAWTKLDSSLKSPLKIKEKIQRNILNLSKFTFNDSDSVNVFYDAKPTQFLADSAVLFLHNLDSSLNFHHSALKNDYILFSFFGKNAAFRDSQQSAIDTLIFKNDTVKCFGFQKFDSLANNKFKLIHYENPDKFLVEVLSADTNTRIFLHKFPYRKMLKAHILLLQNLLKNKQSFIFEEGDKLKIPIIAFDFEQRIDELEKKYFVSDSLDTVFVSLAYQRVIFRLGENCMSKPNKKKKKATNGEITDVNRKFYFNSGFSIILHRKDEEFPFFFIRIENSDLMKRN